MYLKNQPYKLKKLATMVNQKLSSTYHGPFKVLEKIGEVAYRLKLPDDTKVHPVFHVALPKKAVTADTVVGGPAFFHYS